MVKMVFLLATSLNIAQSHTAVPILHEVGFGRKLHHVLFLWEEVACVHSVHKSIQTVTHLWKNEQLFYRHTIPVEGIAPNHCVTGHKHGVVGAEINYNVPLAHQQLGDKQ